MSDKNFLKELLDYDYKKSPAYQKMQRIVTDLVKDDPNIQKNSTIEIFKDGVDGVLQTHDNTILKTIGENYEQLSENEKREILQLKIEEQKIR